MGAILFEETSKDIFSGGERSQLDLHSTFNTGAPWPGERYSSLLYVLETWIFICYSTLSYLLEHLDLLETWTLICENLEPWSIRAFKFYVSEQGKGLKPQSWNWSIMGSFPHSFSHSQLCNVCLGLLIECRYSLCFIASLCTGLWTSSCIRIERRFLYKCFQSKAAISSELFFTGCQEIAENRGGFDLLHPYH